MSQILDLKILHPRAQVPAHQTAGAACFDLHAVIDCPTNSHCLSGDNQNSGITIPPGESHDFGIGLSVQVPAGWVMKIYSRSGHGFKYGIRLANGTGVIDSDFRGELHVKLHNDGSHYFRVEDGDRIAQAMLEPAPQWSFNVISELTHTDRGERGMGSTGS